MNHKQQLVKAGEGENYDYSQDHCYIKVSSVQNGGELCLVEDTLKPGFHLGRHHHKIMTEVFYMLEGQMELIFDDERVILSEGDTITVPPNVWHEAICKGGGKMLTVFHKGRFDQYLSKLSTMTDEEFADAELMNQINSEFDMYN